MGGKRGGRWIGARSNLGLVAVLVTVAVLATLPSPNSRAQDATPSTDAALPEGTPAADFGLTREAPAALDQEVISEDYAVTLLEVVQGTEAAEQIAAADPANPAPAAGTEYLLARVRVRQTEDSNDPLLISPANFGTTGSGNRLLSAATVVPPQPELRGQLVPGGELEGYVVLVAAVGEANRQLVLLPDTGADPETFRYLALDPGASLPPLGTPVAEAVAASPAAQPDATPNALGVAQDAPAGLGAVVLTDRFAIQLVEFVRGEEATALLQAANAFNPTPLPENEHALVRVRVTRIGSDDEPIAVSPLDFSLVGVGNVRYADTGLVPPPPDLDARLYPGGTVEGSIAFEVPRNDPELSLVYQPADDPDAEPRFLAAVASDATPAAVP